MAHWSHCAVNNGPALPVGECDCGNDALSEIQQERIRRGLSIKWHEYPSTGIEVFYDCAVLYRIDGKIYAVPRQLVTLPPSEPDCYTR